MIKLYIIILMITMLFPFSSIRIEKSGDMGRFRFLTGELHHVKEDPESSVRSYLYIIRDKLGQENAHAFPLNYYKNGKNGTRHFSFQQVYKGVSVFGRYIRVHISGDMITSLSSNIENVDLSIVPIITKFGAIDIIQLDYISNSTYLQYKNLQIYIQNSIPYLVHTIDAVNFEDSWRYMVDAHTGKIVDRFSLIYEEGPVIGSGINLLSETVDTLYVYEGSSFTSIGQDLVTPYLLCEEY
ncbi:uncharacterized protein METZ01_LOCUS250397, partial [marine metagenome]